ncbi:MAG: glycosyltransferase [Candidatus Binatia bacterium]
MSEKIPLDIRLIILIPVFNDWRSLLLLLPILEHELNTAGLRTGLLLVDDGSTEKRPESLSKITLPSIERIEVLKLRRNLGHQRAIAVGLSYIAANYPDYSVLIMDGDGEDCPKDVPRLVRECLAQDFEKIVFAARTRRSEGLIFTFFYHLYRVVHWLLTGIPVRVGNFSIVPPDALKRLVAVSELWNHYAAAAHKAKLPMSLIPTERSKRLDGTPHMDLVSLVVHGLSAMAVFGDRIGVRLLLIVSLGILLTVGGMVGVVTIRLATDLAVPGWASYVFGLLFVIMMQMLVVVLGFTFVILAARNAINVIPSRDYVHLMDGVQRIHG